MSHFSLGVITRERPEEFELDEKLKPFDESIPVRSVTSKADIIANARLDLERYTESTMYIDYHADPEAYKKEASEGHIEYLEKTFPKLQAMSDEELYQYEIQYEEPDDITHDGGVVSYYNPNAKWDWWVVGGRWDNIIKNKSGLQVNTEKISEIDDEPSLQAVNELTDLWEHVVEGKELKDPQPFPPSKEFLLGVYETKENFIQIQSGFTTYALLLPSGEWVEPGRMGFFGISDQDIESKRQYMKDRQDIMDRYKDFYITVVDCHI